MQSKCQSERCFCGRIFTCSILLIRIGVHIGFQNYSTFKIIEQFHNFFKKWGGFIESKTFSSNRETLRFSTYM